MNILQFGLLLIAYYVIATAFFGVLVNLMLGYGPRCTFAVSLLATVSLAVAIYLWAPAFRIPLVVGVFALSLVAYRFWSNRARLALVAEERQLRNIEIVAGEHFNDINLSGDGIIKESEIDAALVSEKFSLIEEVVLAHIKRHMEHIGHAIDWLHISSPLSPAVVSLPTYGISREDFSTYTKRFYAKYGGWVKA